MRDVVRIRKNPDRIPDEKVKEIARKYFKEKTDTCTSRVGKPDMQTFHVVQVQDTRGSTFVVIINLAGEGIDYIPRQIWRDSKPYL